MSDPRTPLDRRAFVQRVSLGMVGAALAPRRAPATPIRAVLFDAFPIFDPGPVAAATEAEFPGHGAELLALWRTRQFEYTWLRALSDDYADFQRCTDDALRFAAASLHLELTDARRARLMDAFDSLDPWPDVPQALGALRDRGLRLGVLSNFTPRMLERAIRRAGLQRTFDHVLSTDAARTFKPDPRAYRLGVDALGLRREAIAFAAFAGWDAAGARRFGYPTFWVNRAQAQPEALGAQADAAGTTLSELVTFVAARG